MSERLNKALYELFETRRIQAQRTQTECATIMGVQQPTYAKMVRKLGGVELIRLSKLAQFLSIEHKQLAQLVYHGDES